MEKTAVSIDLGKSDICGVPTHEDAHEQREQLIGGIYSVLDKETGKHTWAMNAAGLSLT